MKTLIQMAVISLLIASCSSIRVASDYNSEIDFGKYRTYGFMQDLGSQNYSDLSNQRIQKAINAQMEQRGYAISEEPDMLINVVTSIETARDITATGTPVFYGRRFGYSVATYDVNVHEYREGSLVIDLVDAGSKNLVWHGTADGTLSEKAEKNQQKIDEAVVKIFEQYPHSAGVNGQFLTKK